MPPPEVVGLTLVDEHGTNFAAVALEVALTVAVDVERAGHAWTVDGVLEDARVDGPALPGHVFRHTDVERLQACHCATPYCFGRCFARSGLPEVSIVRARVIAMSSFVMLQNILYPTVICATPDRSDSHETAFRSIPAAAEGRRA